MTPRRIRYAGPASSAVSTVTTLADADGIDLVSSEPPVRSADGQGVVVLVVTVDGTDETVEAAIARAQADLPPEATLEVE